MSLGLLPKSSGVSVLVKVRREVEIRVRVIGMKYGYEASTIRNLAILLGLKILENILGMKPSKRQLERLYNRLLGGELNAIKELLKEESEI